MRKLVILALLCGSAMAQNVVQSAKCQDWTNYYTSYPCSFSTATTAGNAIIAIALADGATVTGATDNHSPSSNTYTSDLTQNFATIFNITWFSVAGAGSATTLTFTYSTATKVQVLMIEVQGLLASGALKDKTATNDNGYGTTSWTSGATATTSQANEFMVGWAMNSYAPVYTFTDAWPWQMAQQEPIGGGRMAFRTANATGTFAYTGTAAGTGDLDVGSAIVTYKVATPTPPANPPVLFFSDLNFGPNTGWNGSATEGAAVTVWGENFGATQGTSVVTVNGHAVNSGDYREWDAIGPARGLERITFFLDSSMTSGAGTISVTVNGVTSNTLPFTIVAATIYFIDVTNGNDANNGTNTATPFKDIYMFNPGNDGYHTAAQHNPSGDGQYICYIRGGTYTQVDTGAGGYISDGAYLGLLSLSGSPTKQKALIGYPGETVNIQADTVHYFLYTPDDLPSGSTCCGPNYYTFAKLNYGKISTCGANNGCASFLDLFVGQYFRVVGNNLPNMHPAAQQYDGIMFVGDSKYIDIYGNVENGGGYDSYDHGIYVKTQAAYSCCSPGDLGTHDIDIGWNEFANGYASDTHGGQDIFVSKSADAQVSGYYTDRVFIHHNYFHDGNSDFFYVGDNTSIGGSVYMWDNIFKGGPAAGTGNGTLMMYCGGNDVYLYNNTIYSPTSDNANWVSSYSGCNGGPSLLKNHFINNLWQATVNGQVWIYEDTVTSTFDHEIYWQPNGTQNFPSASGVTVTNPTNANPLLVNPPTDYHLQSGSGARGIGTNLYSILSGFNAGTQDYDGKPYASSGAWDVGALEFASSTGGGVGMSVMGLTLRGLMMTQ